MSRRDLTQSGPRRKLRASYKNRTDAAVERRAPLEERDAMKHALTVLASLAAALPLAAAAQTPFPNTGRDLAAACAICHGTDGRSQGGAPGLAGVAKENIAKQMREFRDGKRPGTLMPQLSKGYTDAQIDAVSAFFAAQKAK
jgi:cytochrome c553